MLTSGDMVTNMRLAGLAEAHRATCAADPNAAMTLVYKKCAPGHPTRTARREMVVVAAAYSNNPGGAASGEVKRSSRVLFHRRGVDASKVDFPLEIFEGHPSVSIRFDLSDPFIAICTPALPPLFQDNFDYQGPESICNKNLAWKMVRQQTFYFDSVTCLNNQILNIFPF